jgi:hypothetical protein
VLPVILTVAVDDFEGFAEILGIFVIVPYDEALLVTCTDLVGSDARVVVIETVLVKVYILFDGETVVELVLVLDEVIVRVVVAVAVGVIVYLGVLVCVIVIRGVFVRRLLNVEHPELVDVLLLLADLV